MKFGKKISFVHIEGFKHFNLKFLSHVLHLQLYNNCFCFSKETTDLFIFCEEKFSVKNWTMVLSLNKLITDHVRCMGEGDVFTRVCLFTGQGGEPG